MAWSFMSRTLGIVLMVGALVSGAASPASAQEAPGAVQPPGEAAASAGQATDAATPAGADQAPPPTPVTEVAGQVVAETVAATRPVTEAVARTAKPVTDAAGAVVQETARAVKPVTDAAGVAVQEAARAVAPVTEAVHATVAPVVEETTRAVAPVTEATQRIVANATEPARPGEPRGGDGGGSADPAPANRERAGGDAGPIGGERAPAGDGPDRGTREVVPRTSAGAAPMVGMSGIRLADRSRKTADARRRTNAGSSAERAGRRSPTILAAARTTVSAPRAELPSASTADRRSASPRRQRGTGGGVSQLPDLGHPGSASTGSSASAASGAGPLPACARSALRMGISDELRRLRLADAPRHDDAFVLLLDRPG